MAAVVMPRHRRRMDRVVVPVQVHGFAGRRRACQARGNVRQQAARRPGAQRAGARTSRSTALAPPTPLARAPCAVPRRTRSGRIMARSCCRPARMRFLAVQQVGHADELRDEARGRRVVQRVRRGDLLQAPVVEHADAVAHRQGLVLVVRDEDEGDAQLALQALELGLHLLAQLQVERAQRLVQQQHARLADQRACQRHALALAARKLRRLALGHLGQPHQLQQLAGPRSRAGRAARRAPSGCRRRCPARSCAGTARSPGTPC